MMYALFNDKPSTTIVFYYNHTNVNDEVDIRSFYDGLSSLVQQISKPNVLIIDEDKKAQVSKYKNNEFCM